MPERAAAETLFDAAIDGRAERRSVDRGRGDGACRIERDLHVTRARCVFLAGGDIDRRERLGSGGAIERAWFLAARCADRAPHLARGG